MRNGVGVVTLDPWRGCLGPARRLLPEATVSVDRFHMIRRTNRVVTEVRQRTQQDVLGHRGRKGDLFYDIRRLLPVGDERLSAHQRRHIDAALAHPGGGRYDEVASAWVAKQLLSDVYTAADLPEPYASGRQRHSTITEPTLPTDPQKPTT